MCECVCFTFTCFSLFYLAIYSTIYTHSGWQSVKGHVLCPLWFALFACSIINEMYRPSVFSGLQCFQESIPWPATHTEFCKCHGLGEGCISGPIWTQLWAESRTYGDYLWPPSLLRSFPDATRGHYSKMLFLACEVSKSIWNTEYCLCKQNPLLCVSFDMLVLFVESHCQSFSPKIYFSLDLQHH